MPQGLALQDPGIVFFPGNWSYVLGCTGEPVFPPLGPLTLGQKGSENRQDMSSQVFMSRVQLPTVSTFVPGTSYSSGCRKWPVRFSSKIGEGRVAGENLPLEHLADASRF